MKEMQNEHQFAHLLPAYSRGELDDNERDTVKRWLAESSEARDELAFIEQLSESAAQEEISAPENVRDNFYAELAAMEVDSNQTQSLVNIITRWFQAHKGVTVFAYSLIIFTLGTAFGDYWQPRQQTGQLASARLSSEVDLLKQQVLLSQLEHPSTSVRLRGVRYGLQFDSLPDDVLEILASVVSEDSNKHVRIAAAQVMLRFIDSKKVQQSLVQLTLNQGDAKVQLMLLGMLSDWDKSSAKQLAEKIRQQPKTTKEVKRWINDLI